MNRPIIWTRKAWNGWKAISRIIREPFIVISHDRFFLDKIATQIAELAARHIHIYKGNYSYYLDRKRKAPCALEKRNGTAKSAN